MPRDGFDTDVLVVGAGPTGLTLAAQLVERGVRTRLVDKAAARGEQSRALVVQARTLELLQKMNLADALVARGQRSASLAVLIDGRERVRVELGDIGVDDAPYPFLLFVSQVETERVLEAHAGELGVRAERGLELLGCEQDKDGVTARLRREGAGEQTVRARYVVGCDGAHSAVRKAAGLRFDGAAYDEDFVLADTHVAWDRPPDTVHFFMGSGGGVIVMMPLPDGVWRVIETRTEHTEGSAPPTLEALQERIARTAKIPLRLHDPVWLTRFHLHHRGVDRYRAGRVFVAGDAAHIHSPAGGQGMNTGIQDAYNLGWKLALAVSGKATGAALLDSYQAERRPVGQRLLTFTDRLFAVARSRNPLVWRARNALVPMLAPRMFDDRARRARLFRFVSQLAIRYRKSPIVGESLEGADEAFEHGPAAGHRAPDGPLVLARGGAASTLFARTVGTPHHLLVFGGRDSHAGSWLALGARLGELFARRAGGVETHFIVRAGGDSAASAPAGVYIDPTGVLHARYGLGDRAGHYLVRPDGYVAFRATGTEPAALAAYLRRVYP